MGVGPRNLETVGWHARINMTLPCFNIMTALWYLNPLQEPDNLFPSPQIRHVPSCSGEVSLGTEDWAPPPPEIS
jgi:hypothetical protein